MIYVHDHVPQIRHEIFIMLDERSSLKCLMRSETREASTLKHSYTRTDVPVELNGRNVTVDIQQGEKHFEHTERPISAATEAGSDCSFRTSCVLSRG